MKSFDKKWVTIAGKGGWGMQEMSSSERVSQEKALEDHINEKVRLSGGGGWDSNIGIIKRVWIDENNQLRVRLEKLNWEGHETFEPIIGSWMISVSKKMI
jgi:hypothetical protein